MISWRAGDAYNNVDDPAQCGTGLSRSAGDPAADFGPENPGLALTMMKLAAQISHQRNAPEADRLLDQAASFDGAIQ